MKIEKLPDEVIKKICAGEVITRPYNVVKELLENSIDAGSTNISITISSDVLTVKIEDNGHGIKREDFALLCEAHCTSKLRDRDSITRISTYGFRGEALSSISQVAKITVQSKPVESEFGYECKYSYGKLTEIKPVSLMDGTTFVIKDIFYNNKIRELKFFKKINELNSISNLVFYYAVCNTQSRFLFFVSGKEKFMSKGSIKCNCSKLSNNLSINDNNANPIDNNTNPIDNNTNSFHSGLLKLRKAIIEDSNVSHFHSESCSDRKLSLLESFHNIKDKLHLFDSEYITLICNKPNTDFKKTVFILFVNGRLVENTSLKDYLTKIYLDFLPKYKYPLIYIEIRVPPEDIDINIHPSKKEVIFNHEEIITEILSRVIETRLKGIIKSNIENIDNRQFLKRYKQSFSGDQANTKIYNDPTISSLYEIKGGINNDNEKTDSDNQIINKTGYDNQIINKTGYDNQIINKTNIGMNNKKNRNENLYINKDVSKNTINVVQSKNNLSVLSHTDNLHLLEEVEEVDGLFFKSLTFIGLHERKEFYVQYNQYLLVCDLETFLYNVIKEFFLSNLGHLSYKEVQIHINYEIDHLEILSKYFSIKVEDQIITQIPIVYGQYNTKIEDWAKLNYIKGDNNKENNNTLMETNLLLETILDTLIRLYLKTFDFNSISFNCIKRSIKGTKTNIEMFSILSNLKDLYKKFGR